MVAGINAGLEQGVFRLDGDWAECRDDHRQWRFEVQRIPGSHQLRTWVTGSFLSMSRCGQQRERRN